MKYHLGPHNIPPGLYVHDVDEHSAHTRLGK